MIYNHSLLLKSSAIGSVLGILGMYMLTHRNRDNDSTATIEEDDVSTALREEQERMRIRRESKRQMPVLTSWEREL